MLGNTSTPDPLRSRSGTLVAAAMIAALAVAGCVSISTNSTPRSEATPFGATPGPTRGPAADDTPFLEEDTPEPDVTPRATRRPRATAKPTTPPTPTPRPTRKPTPKPTAEVTPPPEGWPDGAHTSKQAKNHVGESGTVCGVVAAAQYRPNLPGRPTFLNIDKPYPDQRFNVVIWGEQRRDFPLNKKPEVVLLGKEICVTGTISAYVDWTQIAYADRGGTDVVP